MLRKKLILKKLILLQKAFENIIFKSLLPKSLLANYYLENKESLQKKLVKDIKILLKKKKKKSDNMVVNVTKIFQKMKNKRLLSTEKKYNRMRKNALL